MLILTRKPRQSIWKGVSGYLRFKYSDPLSLKPVRNWNGALTRFMIEFPDRMPATL